MNFPQWGPKFLFGTATNLGSVATVEQLSVLRTVRHIKSTFQDTGGRWGCGGAGVALWPFIVSTGGRGRENSSHPQALSLVKVEEVEKKVREDVRVLPKNRP